MSLTVKGIQRITKPGRYLDGDGLYLQVSTSEGPKGRSWLLRYELRGRKRWMGLGPLRTFNLDEARERAHAARKLLADGIDPLGVKAPLAHG